MQVGVGAGIHNCILLTHILKKAPERRALLIEESSCVGGIFSRLRFDYRLHARFNFKNFDTFVRHDEDLNTCGEVVSFIEENVYRSGIQILFDNRVIDIVRTGPREMGKVSANFWRFTVHACVSFSQG